MTITPPTSTPGGDEEVEPIVAVARTVGGLVLMVIGLVLLIGGAFVYFVPPFVAPFAGGIWNTLWDLDFVGAIGGGIGLVLVFLAGAIIRRARKRDLQIQFGAGQMDDVAANINEVVDSAAPGEKRTGTAPPTIV
jgi:hypothetical protein